VSLPRPSAILAPNTAAATAFHRSVIATQARRWSGSGEPAIDAVAAALRATARAELSPAESDALRRVEGRRAELPFAMVETEMAFGLVPATAGAEAPAAPAPSPQERLGHAWEICRWTCIAPIWGGFLFRLLRQLAPASGLELGTGLGLSGAYQASALRLNGSGSLTTIDINDAAQIARQGFDALELGRWIHSELADLDHDLDRIAAARAPLGYAFLDAEHSEAATTRHFLALLPHLADDAVLVFDDITQTDEMRRAWATVAAHPRVRAAIPLRRFGVAVIGGG
jgi:predicted O-methyltransferase YrrM